MDTQVLSTLRSHWEPNNIVQVNWDSTQSVLDMLSDIDWYADGCPIHLAWHPINEDASIRLWRSTLNGNTSPVYWIGP
jgi:hypothetical protein